MIELQDIRKVYNTGDRKAGSGIETVALKKIDLVIEQGESVAIVGKSGCGKTTLLNILGAMDRQTSGEYVFEGMKVSGLGSKEMARFRNRQIGFVFQHFNLINEYSVLENIEMPMGYARISAKERKKRVLELLDDVGLQGYEQKRPSQMSGGQCQRVAIARAMANAPKVLLADEPTGALDSGNARNIMQLLLRINEQGKTLILVTHDISLAGLCKRVITLEDGEIRKESKGGEFCIP